MRHELEITLDQYGIAASDFGRAFFWRYPDGTLCDIDVPALIARRHREAIEWAKSLRGNPSRRCYALASAASLRMRLRDVLKAHGGRPVIWDKVSA